MEICVGDIVRRVEGGEHHGMKVGDFGTVESVNEDIIKLKEYPQATFHTPFYRVAKRNEGETNVMNASEIAKKLENLKGQNVQDLIDNQKRYIRNYETEVQDAINHMNRYYKQIREAMIEIKRLEAQLNVKEDYTSEIQNILDHKYVEKIVVVGDKSYDVYTDYIDIYDEEGNRFRGNKYKLSFNYARMECRIYGLEPDLCRKSYWTKYDPHPHVNGDSGRACWGDAGSMLSMNMNEFELYASFIVVLNFLQQVNTNDPAGAYICNWDCIDDDNNDIENPYEDVNFAKCTVCDEDLSEDEATYCEECGEYCCDSHSYWIEDIQLYVCEHCYDNYYGKCAHCEERFHEENLTEIHGDTYCEHCRDELFIQCDNCDEYEPNDRVFYCEGCGRHFCLDCEEEQDGLCSECYEEREEEENDEC